MKKLLLAACAVVATPLIAQTMPAPMPAPVPGVAGRDAMMNDRVQTRAEVVARTQRMFAMVDTNRDAALDQSEISSARGKWAGMGRRGGGHATGGKPMDGNAMFAMIDANRDGMISRDEFARHHDGMGKGGHAMGNDGHDMGNHAMGGHAMGGHRIGMKGGGMGRMMAMADTNKDGRLTQAEATDFAVRRFDMADTNRDGQVTRDERIAARAQMKAMRGQ